MQIAKCGVECCPANNLPALEGCKAVLRVANPTKPYILQTDASERGLGVVLSQVDAQGEEHPVAFTSRKLLPQEMNYSTIEK